MYEMVRPSLDSKFDEIVHVEDISPEILDNSES